MPDKDLFVPEKLSIIDFKIIKGQVEAVEDFDIQNVLEYDLENNLELAFNFEDKLIKAEYSVDIKTISKAADKTEAKGYFHFLFVIHVDNFEKLAQLKTKNLVILEPSLATAVASIVYSTSRGVLLTRFQGTALQNFILPVINPNNLLVKSK